MLTTIRVNETNGKFLNITMSKIRFAYVAIDFFWVNQKQILLAKSVYLVKLYSGSL